MTNPNLPFKFVQWSMHNGIKATLILFLHIYIVSSKIKCQGDVFKAIPNIMQTNLKSDKSFKDKSCKN